MQMTLDGYLWDSEGMVDWVDSWADGLESCPPSTRSSSGAGCGRTYERFWTTILDDPEAAAEMLGRDPYPREVAYARVAAATPHLVLSGTLVETTWPTARVVRDLGEIRALKQEPGRTRLRGRGSRAGRQPHRLRACSTSCA